MKKLFLLVPILIFLSHGVCYSQEGKQWEKFEKDIFFSDFSLELLNRNFENGSFLGDSYQVNLGYRINFDFGVSGYPGLGFYASGNSANVLENQFLGGFFAKARFREGGLFVFYDLPIGNRWVVRPELGFGNFRVVHGFSPSRFILNYSHFFGKVNMQYRLVEISENFILSATLGAEYGLNNGRGIIINDQDRNYIQRAKGYQVSTGLLLKIY
ncbi:hypothetical protein [Algoriphagus sp.]|uniref:hypothetical protein n=1 Tax=Algoriphagus sp. TaxID=1872435 RepID=UPI00391C2995